MLVCLGLRFITATTHSLLRDSVVSCVCVFYVCVCVCLCVSRVEIQTATTYNVLRDWVVNCVCVSMFVCDCVYVGAHVMFSNVYVCVCGYGTLCVSY